MTSRDAPASDDAAIERTLFELLDARAATSTICPSEVARALAPDSEAAWRAMMPAVRRVAASLARADRLAVLQRGVPVDAETARGPIRLKRR